MKTCAAYIDDKSCLSCPYEDGKQPCMRKSKSMGIVTVPMPPEQIAVLDHLAKEMHASRAAVVRALIEKGLQFVNPEWMGGGQAFGGNPDLIITKEGRVKDAANYQPGRA